MKIEELREFEWVLNTYYSVEKKPDCKLLQVEWKKFKESLGVNEVRVYDDLLKFLKSLEKEQNKEGLVKLNEVIGFLCQAKFHFLRRKSINEIKTNLKKQDGLKR